MPFAEQWQQAYQMAFFDGSITTSTKRFFHGLYQQEEGIIQQKRERKKERASLYL